ncbi:uncharacterized protein [Argopecten irradians]|uniref:uncharacterized protein n=1 Tax=Argopecten irradians TaxID=31199 RepID=UPI003715D85D
MSALWQPEINGPRRVRVSDIIVIRPVQTGSDIIVLLELAIVVEEERRRKRPKSTPGNTKIFVREGETLEQKKAATTSLLDRGKDWELKVDLDGRLVFPIVETTLRPDMVLITNQSRTIIVVELTVLWEENCEEAHEMKNFEYADLIADCKEKGWKAWLFAVEVGCRGFPAQSTKRLLQHLGVRGKTMSSAMRRTGEAAEKASCWLWHRRVDLEWKSGSIE